MHSQTFLIFSTLIALAMLAFLFGLIVHGGLARKRQLAASFAGSALPPALPAGKVPVWFYRRIDFFGFGTIIVLFVLFGLGTVVATSSDKPAAVDVNALVTSIMFQFAFAAGVSVSLARRVSLSDWLGLRWRSWPMVFAIVPGAIGVMFALMISVQQLGYMEWVRSMGAETMQETVQLLQESNDTAVVALMAFTAMFVAPICEEIVFRGYLYPIAKKYTNRWLAVLFTGLIFSIGHGSLAALLPLFILGSLLALVYEFTGSIWAPIAVHFCFNSLTVGIQIFARLNHIELPTPT